MKLIHHHSVRFLNRHLFAAIVVAAGAIITAAAIIILNLAFVV